MFHSLEPKLTREYFQWFIYLNNNQIFIISLFLHSLSFLLSPFLPPPFPSQTHSKTINISHQQQCLNSQLHNTLFHFQFSHPKTSPCRSHSSSSTMHITTMSIESNKENIPPVYTKGVNTKISISIMASSCKRSGKRKIKKRTPLADITHLFHNSMTRQENGVSSASIQLHLDSRRRALAVVSGSKKLRIGFR